MRTHSLVVTAAAILCTAWVCVGCGSESDSTGTADPNSTGPTGNGTDPSQPNAGTTAPGTTPGTTPGATPGATPGTTPGTTPEKTPTGTPGAGVGAAPAPPGSPGSPCVAGALVETEINDSADTANVIPAVTSTFCGRLPNVQDVDFLTFTLPTNAKTIAFGKGWDKAVIGAEVTVDDGRSFLVGDTPILKPGSKYVMKIWIKGPGTATDYSVGVAITQ